MVSVRKAKRRVLKWDRYLWKVQVLPNAFSHPSSTIESIHNLKDCSGILKAYIRLDLATTHATNRHAARRSKALFTKVRQRREQTSAHQISPEEILDIYDVSKEVAVGIATAKYRDSKHYYRKPVTDIKPRWDEDTHTLQDR